MSTKVAVLPQNWHKIDIIAFWGDCLCDFKLLPLFEWHDVTIALNSFAVAIDII